MAFKRNCLGTSASWATQENKAKGYPLFRSGLRLKLYCKQFLPRDGFRHVATSWVSVAKEGPAGHEAACAGRM